MTHDGYKEAKKDYFNYELFEGYKRIYNDKIMIISIGIGTQGALPGSALYAGATCEGIGRFIFNGVNGIDSPGNITKKADLCQTIYVTRSCVKIPK